MKKEQYKIKIDKERRMEIKNSSGTNKISIESIK